MWAEDCYLQINVWSRKGTGWGWLLRSRQRGLFVCWWGRTPGRQGWSGPISLCQCSFIISCTGGGFNIRWCPSTDCPKGRLHKGAIVSVPSSPCPSATQLTRFLNDSCTSQATDLLPESKMSVCECVSLCTGPLLGHLDFQRFIISRG